MIWWWISIVPAVTPIVDGEISQYVPSLILNTSIVLSQICVYKFPTRPWFLGVVLTFGSYWIPWKSFKKITMNHPFNPRNPIKSHQIPSNSQQIPVNPIGFQSQAVQILTGCFLANPLNESSKAETAFARAGVFQLKGKPTFDRFYGV